MERDVPAIKELLRVVESSAEEAKILAVAGVSISERIQWENSMMSFGHLIGSLEWVVKNTESAIASEATEAKRRADNAEYWRRSDEEIRSKQAAEDE